MPAYGRPTLGLITAAAITAMVIFLLRGRFRLATGPAPAGTAADSLAAAPPTAATARIFATIGDSGSRIEGIAEHAGMSRLGAADFKPRRGVEAFASGAKGANGLAFDANGHLWISGGVANAVYHVGPKGGPAQVFAKGYALVSDDTTMPIRAQVTNGLGIDSSGNVYTANTGTGEITRVEVKPGYELGAITTVAKDGRLLGADGLLVDGAGNVWVSANFSNTLARVSPAGAVTVVLHDSAATALHFPAELKRVGRTFYLANLNFPVGANSRTAYKGAQIAAVEVPWKPSARENGTNE
jgi:hypothetical protein